MPVTPHIICCANCNAQLGTAFNHLQTEIFCVRCITVFIKALEENISPTHNFLIDLKNATPVTTAQLNIRAKNYWETCEKVLDKSETVK